MVELSFVEMFNNSIQALSNSKVAILFILEAVVLLLTIIFSKLMNKKVVKTTTTITSLIVLGFYISNYIETVGAFMNNVTSRLIEFLYFPTTLEYIVVMLISLTIMAITLINKKSNMFIKIINVVIPVVISFLFLSIIETINTSGIDFDEFSVFTDATMMSLYEFAMILFIVWIMFLLIYKVDKFIITKATIIDINRVDNKLVTVNLDALEDDIEMPRLKTEVKNI